MDKLKFFGKLEKMFKELNLMGSKIRILEDYKKNGEFKFSRKYYTIDEIEFTFGDVIQFWVSNGGKCLTVALENMLISILFTSTKPKTKEFENFKKISTDYLLGIFNLRKVCNATKALYITKRVFPTPPVIKLLW